MREKKQSRITIPASLSMYLKLRRAQQQAEHLADAFIALYIAQLERLRADHIEERVPLVGLQGALEEARDCRIDDALRRGCRPERREQLCGVDRAATQRRVY